MHDKESKQDAKPTWSWSWGTEWEVNETGTFFRLWGVLIEHAPKGYTTLGFTKEHTKEC